MSDMPILDYFYGEEAEQYTFCRIQRCHLRIRITGKYLLMLKSCMGVCLTVWGCHSGMADFRKNFTW